MVWVDSMNDLDLEKMRDELKQRLAKMAPAIQKILSEITDMSELQPTLEARAEGPDFAETVLAAIQKLYRIERQAKDEALSGEALVDLRRREAKPVLERGGGCFG